MEDKDVLEEEKKKKGVARGCSGCFKVVASTFAILFLTMYGYFYTQREGPHGFGPYTGIVLDAETKEPIKEAQIYLRIGTTTLIDGLRGWGGKVYDYYYQTNSKGKYRIRKHVILRSIFLASNMDFFVYKAGYIAYNNKIIFNVGFRNDFQNKNNVILLEKWDDEKFTMKDHGRHIGFLGGALACYPKAKRFCEEAREEMILDCMNANPTYPTIRELCEKHIDKKIYRERGNTP